MNKPDLYATSSNASKVQVYLRDVCTSNWEWRTKVMLLENEHFLSITAHRMENVALDEQKKQSLSTTVSKQRYENLENQAQAFVMDHWIRAGNQQRAKNLL